MEPPGDERRIQKALRQMKARYQEAQEVGEKSGTAAIYYPASNRLAADVALNAGARGKRRFDQATAELIRKHLQDQSAADPDFWSVVGEIELDQYEALAKRKLAASRATARPGLRGSAQARDGHEDVGVGVRHRVPRAAQLRQSRDGQGEGRRRGTARRSSARTRIRKRSVEC